ASCWQPFCMKDMAPLRLVALCSNLAFITYGCALGLTPIWLPHALLLSVNGCRLVEAARSRRRPANITSPTHPQECCIAAPDPAVSAPAWLRRKSGPWH